MNSSHMAPTYDFFLFREFHFKCHWMFFLLKMSHPIHYCHTVLFQVTLDSYLVHWGSESWKCRLPLLNEMVSTGDTAISLHIRTPWNSGGGGGCNPDKLKLKVPRYAQIFIFRRGGVTPDKLKLEVSRLAQILILGVGYSRQTILKYMSGGTQGILNQKFWYLECVVHRG